MTDYPSMVGTGDLMATQEIHHFLLPLNPDGDTLEQYYDAVTEWNTRVLPTLNSTDIIQTSPMKPCYLALIFRKEGVEQEVCVMQSARYVRCNIPDLVVKQCQEDTKFFKQRGFQVVREKIEASSYGISGIPLTDEDANKYPKYFEFHIKVRRKDREDYSPISDDEIDQLKKIAVTFSNQYKIPIPLSFNKNKDKTNKDGKGHQRFLNVRFRNQGLNTIKPKVDLIKAKINTDTSFTVTKVISEYVWYDTYSEMDHGWIDFTPEEFTAAYS